MTNWVAVYLCFKTLTNLIPTIILFYVIYYIPNQSGKIKRIQIRGDDITITNSNSLVSNDSDIMNLKDNNND